MPAGQPTEVKLEAFPFTRFGTVPGTVRLVSRHAVGGSASVTSSRPDAEARGSAEEGGYRITVGLDRARMAAEWRGVALRPGMAAQADVVTGKRRVIAFLLDPVVRHAKDRAMNASSIKTYGSQMQVRSKSNFKLLRVVLIPVLLTMAQNLTQEAKASNDEIRIRIGLQLKSMSASSYVKIYLIPKDLYFRTDIDAAKIEKYSCEFVNTNDKTDMPARIVTLIEKNIKSATDGQHLNDDFRGGIKSGGTEVYLDRLTKSGTISGKIGNYHIVLNESFLSSLFDLINKNNFLIVSNAEISTRYNCSFDKSLYSG